MEVRARAFQLDDMLRINLREIDERVGTDIDSGVMKAAAAAERGEAFTILADSDVLLIGGIIMIFSGVGEMWSLTGQEVERNKVGFHKAVMDIMHYWEKAYNLHRLQCKVFVEHKRSQRWLESLGFRNEGLMRKYDSKGRDFYMYARVK